MSRDGAEAWSVKRYLLVVLLATLAALGTVAWARPSMFTSIVVVAGLGYHRESALPDSFYSVRVAPILEEQCAGCHGPRLQRARLRLDTLGDVKLGGKNGAVVKAGHPQESELFTRLLLPKSDKRAMPAGNKPPLSPDEIKVIELWIASGASGRTAVAAIAGAPPPPPAPIVIANFDAEAVARARAPLKDALESLSARYPGAIAYLSRDSADLSVDAQRLGAAFTDANLAELAPLAAAVTRLDLSNTAVTDGATATLAAFERLETLRLNETKVGDELLSATANLRNLQSLTVIGTRVTPDRVAQLRQKGLRVHDARD